jgi:hypothetical protein
MYGRTRSRAPVLERKRAGGRAQNWGAKSLANATRNYAYLLGLTNCSRPVGDPVGFAVGDAADAADGFAEADDDAEVRADARARTDACVGSAHTHAVARVQVLCLMGKALRSTGTTL